MALDNNHFKNSLALTQSHYENFPVASFLLPKELRLPIAVIYSFARQADDFADEGEYTDAQRLELLSSFEDELTLLQAYIVPKINFFVTLGSIIKTHRLPFAPFFDLLNAFKQDVIVSRYANYDDVLDYCKRSANPIGLLLLYLYRAATPENILHSNNICTALQLINFYQDVAIDFKKQGSHHRIYLCQDELSAFGITEQTLSAFVARKMAIDGNWTQFMDFNLHRAKALLFAGKPLGRILTGRIGLEMRMIIAGGERIIHKISKVEGDIFNQRPTLNSYDWSLIFIQALLKR